MAGRDYARVRAKTLPRTRERETPEARYWRGFRNPSEERLYGAVSCIDFSPAAPHDYAVTSATRVHVFAGKGGGLSLRKSTVISRFDDTAYSARFRRDGKLLVAGCEDGVVRAFDAASRSMLRQFRGHERGVRATCFLGDNLRVLSAADDATAFVWDLPTGEAVSRVEEQHGDYVRCVAPSLASPDVFATGCYDHKVRLWDARALGGGGGSGAPAFCADHGAPVEALLMLPGGGLLLSAGGTEVKVWDTLAGGRLVATLPNHAKTVMALALDGTGARLLTGSLDGHVKVYDVATYEVVHGFRYAAPVLAVGLPPDNSVLAAGMTTRALSVRTRPRTKAGGAGAGGAGGAGLPDTEGRVAPRGGTYRFFLRGQNASAAAADLRVEHGRKQRLKPYDQALRSFQYQAALDAALETKQAAIVVGLLEELVQRSALRIAIAGRDEQSLEPLLAFLIRYVADPRFAAFLVDVCGEVFDVYAPVLGQSIVVDELFVRLHTALRTEIRLQQKLFKLAGTMDAVLAASV